MAAWNATVNQRIAALPGCDDGFSPEQVARYAEADLSQRSTWNLVCEEVLDTQYPKVYFEHIREELLCRGITAPEIEAMRRVAWLTVGWLNFQKLLWDWTNLDAADMYRAIAWQFRDGWISQLERDQMTGFIQQYDVQ